MMIADAEEWKPNYGRAFSSFSSNNNICSHPSWSYDETYRQGADICTPLWQVIIMTHGKGSNIHKDEELGPKCKLPHPYFHKLTNGTTLGATLCPSFSLLPNCPQNNSTSHPPFFSIWYDYILWTHNFERESLYKKGRPNIPFSWRRQRGKYTEKWNMLMNFYLYLQLTFLFLYLINISTIHVQERKFHLHTQYVPLHLLDFNKLYHFPPEYSTI